MQDMPVGLRIDESPNTSAHQSTQQGALEEQSKKGRARPQLLAQVQSHSTKTSLVSATVDGPRVAFAKCCVGRDRSQSSISNK
jgi:hypothetical protein